MQAVHVEIENETKDHGWIVRHTIVETAAALVDMLGDGLSELEGAPTLSYDDDLGAEEAGEITAHYGRLGYLVLNMDSTEINGVHVAWLKVSGRLTQASARHRDALVRHLEAKGLKVRV